MSTITVDPEAVETVRDALAIELQDQAKALAQDLEQHLGGSPVGLADARSKCKRVGWLARALEDLDPDGWRQTLGRAREDG